eukprot:CAMPEP_0168557630 /NCGR_PEP_ID=MMETSP0413-20121227/9529_1 /TAXON_ID=136452 /ORGANISM="Filamoeba nolandi, Strain NC-AS-23-1" /LENGTH=146 /DNA_ID=CAMNT_0008588677 /DNA_START=42 /DNA_END=482 /DNA_ORIENTATION=-
MSSWIAQVFGTPGTASSSFPRLDRILIKFPMTTNSKENVVAIPTFFSTSMLIERSRENTVPSMTNPMIQGTVKGVAQVFWHIPTMSLRLTIQVSELRALKSPIKLAAPEVTASSNPTHHSINSPTINETTAIPTAFRMNCGVSGLI